MSDSNSSIDQSLQSVALVILNYNGQHWLQKFLPGVVQHSAGAQIIVADNASQDESLAYLEENHPEVDIIRLEQNFGFCGGYNRALAQVEADYFVLLNSDVEVSSGWLVPLFHLMENNPEIAACQPKILSQREKGTFEYAGAAGGFLDYLGYPYCRGRIFEHVEPDEGQYDDTVDIFWATGACLFIRAGLYRSFSGLDEDFFAHMEEVDLCWRLQNAGWRIAYCGQSHVYHVGGGTLSAQSSMKTYLNFRNNLALLFKNLPNGQLFWILFCRAGLDLITSVYFLSKGQWKNIQAIGKAYWDFYRRLAYWRKKRKSLTIEKKKIPRVPKSIVLEYFIKRKTTYPEIIR